MRFSFDKVVNRKKTQSLKWDVAEGELPMWVADMDFKTAPVVIEAIEKRAAHGIYGYNTIPKEWSKAISGWWKKRHGYKIAPESLVFCTGVIPAISTIVRRFTAPNEKVLLQTPVYNTFFNSIINNGRQVIESPLTYNGKEYSIDFADLELKLSDPQTTLMILCNPHNPIGKVWDADTLKKIGDLCFKHHVLVVSDEIHCDIVDPGVHYVPYASVSDRCAMNSITCVSATKAFNIAGLQTAAVYSKNEELRHKVWRALNTDEVAEPNSFAIWATVAAFTKGEEWLNALNKYIYKNKQMVNEFIAANLPNIKVVPSQATYLLWLDCSAKTKNTEKFAEEIREKTGLYVSAGSIFGGNGNKFIRINIACPKSVLTDGLERLKKAME